MSVEDKRRLILNVLNEYGEVNITKLAKLTGLTHRVLEKHIKELLEKGLIEERRYGKLRLIRLSKPRF